MRQSLMKILIRLKQRLNGSITNHLEILHSKWKWLNVERLLPLEVVGEEEVEELPEDEDAVE